MRAIVGGTVASVTQRSYNNSDGQRVTVADVYLGTAPYFDKVTMPTSIAPAVGEDVEYVALVKAKSVVAKRTGERHTFLDVWCVERVSHGAGLRAVGE